MDPLMGIFILLAITAGLGLGGSLFFRVVYVYCEWRENEEIDWGWQTILLFCLPLTWLYVIFEIALLYCK